MPGIARVGDHHDCPLHGPNSISAGGTGELEGRAIARKGDPCACGGVIVEGSSISTLDGQPVAYLGCKTSCGGTITTGSAIGEVSP